MQDDSLFPPPSPAKTPRKRRSKSPTTAELAEQLEATKKALRTARANDREEHIERMGFLAHKAGLAAYDSLTLSEGFAALAKRLAGVVVLCLLCTGCVSVHPRVDPPEPGFPGAFLRSYDYGKSRVACTSRHTTHDTCQWQL